MKTKKIILGLCVSLMVEASAVKAMETPVNDITTNTMSTTSTLNIPNEEIKKHENPYKTGFWDKLIHNSAISDDEKLKIADERIERQTSLYELFIGQLNEYIKKNVKNNSVDQEAAKAIKLFFSNKLERIEDAYFQLMSRMDAQKDDMVDVNDVSFCFKTYSGKLNGKPKEQAEYALGKYLNYREMKHFIKLFPIDPPALNPILAKTIFKNIKEINEEGYNRVKAAFDRCNNHYATMDLYEKWGTLPSFTAISEETLFVKLSEEDTLAYFINTRYKKWRDRLDQEQKMKIFTQSSKSLADSLIMLDNSNPKQLTLGYEKKQD